VVTLMVTLFWASLGALLYTYLLFPLLVGLRGILLRRPYRSAAIHPRVSLLIAARNEEAAIGAKLDNLDALEYPADCLQIIIASDGSEDATEEIVAAHRGRAVRARARRRRSMPHPRRPRARSWSSPTPTAVGPPTPSPGSSVRSPTSASAGLPATRSMTIGRATSPHTASGPTGAWTGC
jgi:glycosyl transferase family 2